MVPLGSLYAKVFGDDTAAAARAVASRSRPPGPLKPSRLLLRAEGLHIRTAPRVGCGPVNYSQLR